MEFWSVPDLNLLEEKTCKDEDFTTFSCASYSTAVKLATSTEIQRIESNVGLQGSAKLLANKLLFIN